MNSITNSLVQAGEPPMPVLNALPDGEHQDCLSTSLKVTIVALSTIFAELSFSLIGGVPGFVIGSAFILAGLTNLFGCEAVSDCFKNMGNQPSSIPLGQQRVSMWPSNGQNPYGTPRPNRPPSSENPHRYGPRAEVNRRFIREEYSFQRLWENQGRTQQPSQTEMEQQVNYQQPHRTGGRAPVGSSEQQSLLRQEEQQNTSNRNPHRTGRRSRVSRNNNNE